MDFLGVGPMELIFILIIALIVLGPKDMVKAGRSMGVFLRRIMKSPTWHAVQQTSRDLRYLPNRLAREAGLEEEAEELKKIGLEMEDLSKSPNSIAEDINKATREINRDLSAWTTPPMIDSPPAPSLEPKSSESDNPKEAVPGSEEPDSTSSEDNKIP